MNHFPSFGHEYGVENRKTRSLSAEDRKVPGSDSSGSI